MGKAEEIINSVNSWPLQEMLRSVYGRCIDLNNENLLVKIIEAMSITDRKYFVGSGSRNIENAYDDGVLYIEDGQTISQPTTVVRMLMYADLKKGDNVLEVGSGSGWNASLIAFLVYPGEVVSVERAHIQKAEYSVNKFKGYLEKNKSSYADRIENIRFIEENIFSKGQVWKRKYDKIIITAGIPNYNKGIADKVENLAANLLNKNGILICPYTEGPIVIYRKNDKLEREETAEQYSFVPLVEK